MQRSKKNSDDDGDDRDEDYDDSKQNNHESDYDSKRQRMIIARNRVCDDYRDDDDDPIALITRFAAVWIRVCLLEVQCFLLRGVGLQACTCTNLSCLATTSQSERG